MTIAVPHVDGVTGTGASGCTTPSWTSTALSTIVVLVNYFDVAGALANGDVTDSKGNTYTKLTDSGVGAGQVGIGVWVNEAGTRGSSHTVSFDPGEGGFPVIGIAEVTADGRLLFDASTDALSTDATSSFDVTAAAELFGNQIGFYASALDTGNDNAWGAPSGYTPVYEEPDGSLGGLLGAYYKIGATGTPVVGATKGGSIAAAHNVFVSFQESPYVVSGSYDDFNSATVPRPTGAATGDCYVVVCYEEPSSPLASTISGFTRVRRHDATGSQDIQQSILFKWHDAGDTTDFTLSDSMAGAIFLVRGADPNIDPIIGTQWWEDVGGSPATVRGITTFSPNNLLLLFQNSWDAHGGDIASSGFTHVGGHAINNIVEVLAGNAASPGATGDTTTTWSSGSFSTITALMAFAPGPPTALVVPTIVDRQTAIGSSTVTKPTFGQLGDFYVMSVECENASVPADVDVDGFTSCGYVTAHDSNFGGLDQTFLVLYRAHDGEEPLTSFTVLNGPGGTYIEAFIVRGADPGTPLFNAAVGFSSGSGGSGSIPGVTTTRDNALAIVMAHAPYVASIDLNNGFASLAAWDSDTAEIFTNTIETAGAVGTSTLTWTTTDKSIAAGIIAFHPLSNESDSSTTTPQSVSGAITPTGVLGKLVIKGLAGAILPTGALAADFLDTAHRSTGAITKLTLKNTLGGGLTPTGALTTEFIDGSTGTTYDQGADGAITPTGALTKLTNKALAGGLTPAGALAKVLSRTLTGGLTPTGEVDVVVVEPLSGTIAPTGALTKVTDKALAGGLTPAATLTRQTNKVTSGGITPSGQVDAVVYEPLSGSIVPTGALAKVTNKALAGSIASSGALARATIFARALSGALTPAGALAKLTNKALGGGLTPAGIATKVTNKVTSGGLTPSGQVDAVVYEPLSGSVTPSGALTKLVAKALSGGLTPSGALIAGAVWARSYSGEIIPSGALTPTFISGSNTEFVNVDGTITPGPGALTFLTNKVLGGELVPAGQLTKLVARALAGELVPAGQVDAEVRAPLTGSIAPTGALTKITAKALGGGLTPAGAFDLGPIYKALDGTITPSGSLTKVVVKSFGGTITSSGTFDHQQFFSLSGVIMPTGALTKLTSRALTGTVTLAGQATKVTAKPTSGAVTSSGSLSTTVVATRTLSGSLTPTGALTRLVAKGLSGASTPQGSCTKRLSRALSGSLTPTATLVASHINALALNGTVALSASLQRQVAKALSAIAAPTGALGRTVTKPCAGSITPAGACSRAFTRDLAGTMAMAGSLSIVYVSGISQHGDARSGEVRARVRSADRRARIRSSSRSATIRERESYGE